MLKHGLLTLSFLVLTQPCFAEAPYVDDRSSATAVIESFYNAINRKEFARAWDYFGEKPDVDFAVFAKGFEKTIEVQVLIGPTSSDGAAGTMFHNVPVSLRSVNEGAEDTYFAGCYTLKQLNPANQQPPFKPLSISKAKLKGSSSTDLGVALPKNCGDGPAVDPDQAMFQRARDLFHSQPGETCYDATHVDSGGTPGSMYALNYRLEGDLPDTPERKTLLFSFQCYMAAYNSVEVYYIWDDLDGLRPLPFAMPDFVIKYEDENSEKLKSLTVTGFASEPNILNSSFDENTKSISMFAKWRGLSDASASGTWTFRAGRFVLTDYSVDPTYDGEMESIDVIKNGKLIPLP